MCITFGAPKAKPNSVELNSARSRGGVALRRAAARSLLRPSSEPSDASISQAALPATIAASTFS